MRILSLIGTLDPGGAEEMVVSLSRELMKNGNEVVVGHLGNPWLRQELKKQGIEQEIFEFSAYYNSNLTGPLFVWRLARYIRKRGFDIVHAHLFGMIVFGTFAALLARIPIIGTIHDTYYIQERKIRSRAYRFVSRLGCRLVAVSKNMQSIVCRLTGLGDDHVRTIHNGVDINKFPVSNMNHENSHPPVISVGRLSSEKDFGTLIRSAREVQSRIPESVFLIAGDGPMLEELKGLARDLALGDSVRFLGQRDDVPELLGKASLFVLSSLTEGLSMSILEAMAAGRPVVVTDVGGNREIVVNGETGFLVPPGNPEALAEKICTLLRDKHLAEKFGENGRRRILSLFSRERMVEDYQELYKSLTLSKGAKGIHKTPQETI